MYYVAKFCSLIPFSLDRNFYVIKSFEEVLHFGLFLTVSCDLAVVVVVGRSSISS